jgi:hypothetical protein
MAPDSVDSSDNLANPVGALSGDLPGVTDADLAEVTQTLVSQPDLSEDEADRFFAQVHTLAEIRARKGWPLEGVATIAIFVRTEHPRRWADSLGHATPVADLAATSTPLMGRIFLLDRNASQGWSGDLPSSDPGVLIEWLKTLPFGTGQIILLYRDTLVVVERARGAAAGATRQEDVRASAVFASEAELIKALNLFHVREVLTPRPCPEGVWRRGHASSYHAGPTPEKSIQGRLKTFLNGWFRDHLRAEPEDETEIGRIDIRLLERGGPGEGLRYWGIIELKVVKSFRHPRKGTRPVKVGPTENARDVAEGIRQAHAFAINRGVACSMLEIYDMRAQKAADPRVHPVVLAALQECVPHPTMRLCPIFGSASQARAAGYFPPA